MKIGMMGGTFDPIHNGHLHLAQTALTQFDLDQIWFMPNGMPPHKKQSSIESDIHERIAMTQIAIKANKQFYLQEYEAKREKVSYSYKTMEHFRKMYPDDEFYFIIGADSLFSIETWKHPERLFKACIILAACRDEAATKESLNGQIQMLKGKYGAHIKFLAMPLEHVSSHEIRKLIESGEPVSEYIPAEVEAYIRKEGLYGSEIEKISKKLMKELDEDRYRHTQGVMYTSAALAMRYGADLKKALLAGLLHDCAKCIPGHTKIKMCEKYNLEISEIERKNPSLLHAKLGAYLAKDKYDIEDEEILMAIRSHTTGRPGMSLLEKIVYIADYMEPGRKDLPNMMDVRHLAFEDIDKCLYRILRDSLVYLKAQDMPIDQTTEETYQYYNELYSKH